jgi:hypothetical protein
MPAGKTPAIKTIPIDRIPTAIRISVSEKPEFLDADFADLIEKSICLDADFADFISDFTDLILATEGTENTEFINFLATEGTPLRPCGTTQGQAETIELIAFLTTKFIIFV